MQATKDVTIDGIEYTIHHFGGVEGLKLATELGKRIAPVIAPLIELRSGVTEGLPRAVAKALVDGLDANEVADLVLRLLARTEAKGLGLLDRGKFEKHFGARLGDLLPLLAAIVEHNFAGFFSGLLGAIPGMLRPAAPEATSEATGELAA